MITRDFDAMLAEKTGSRPTFKVAGQKFALRAKLPAKRWADLMKFIRSDDTNEYEAAEKFFSTVVARPDRQRFLDLLAKEDDEDEDTLMDMSQLDAIIDWAMEYFTGKLQASSSSSSPTANGTGAPSKVVSLTPRGAAG